jgi:hypothetical protein
MLALWRPVVIAHRNRTREVQGQLNFSCCFARCTKNTAKGPGDAMDKVGVVALNRFKRVFLILLLTYNLLSATLSGAIVNHRCSVIIPGQSPSPSFLILTNSYGQRYKRGFFRE